MAKSSLGRKAMSTLVATTMVVSLNAPVSAWADNDDATAEANTATEQPQENASGGGSLEAESSEAEQAEAEAASGVGDQGSATHDGMSAESAVTTSDELKAAIASAQDGAIIYLEEGNYTTYGMTSCKKALTFRGVGDKAKIVWTVGDLSKNAKGQGNGDSSFEGSSQVTFEGITLEFGSDDYRGFTQTDKTVVNDCILSGKSAYWGYIEAEFKGCTFNAPGGDYALWDYSSQKMTLDNCEFNVAGKTINAYNEEKTDVVRTIAMTDCTVNSSDSSRAVLNLKNSSIPWRVELSGNNTVTGISPDKTTGSAWYQVEYDSSKIAAEGGKPVQVYQDNNLVYEAKAEQSGVAEINGTSYETLQKAVEAAKSGETVKLLAGANVDSMITVDNGRTITLDVNGKNVTSTLGTTFKVRNGFLTVKDSAGTGKISVSGEAFRVAGNNNATNWDSVSVPSELTIQNGVTVESSGDCCVYYYGNGAKATVAGHLKSTGDYGTIMGQGTISSTVNNSGTALTIEDGANIEYPRSGAAIYHPQVGSLTVNGGTITGGDTAIEIRRGELVVNDGLLESTSKTFSCQTNTSPTSGSTSAGMAVAVAPHGAVNGLGSSLKVAINGGTLKGIYGLYQEDPDNRTSGSSPVSIDMGITGGVLESTGSVEVDGVSYGGALFSGQCKDFVSGGTFSSKVSADYCAAGYATGAKSEDGTYSVVSCAAQVTDAAGEPVGTYDTLKDAIAASEDGQTITLTKDSSGDGIQVPSDKFVTGLTVDFAGHSYTFDGVLVGSTGTSSNGFQLLKGNTIVMQNGSIGATSNCTVGDASTEWSGAPAILMQNYSNLTLDKMTVTGGSNTVYTLSNNNGDTVIRDSQVVAGGGTEKLLPRAFDVCRFSSYPSVSVTVEGSSVIKGNIEISGTVGASNSRQLSISGGTFEGEFKLADQSARNNPNISISGGSFAKEVPSDYCADGYVPTKDDTTGKYGVKVDTESGWVDVAPYRSGDAYTAPEAPAAGQAFVGWYTDEKYTTPLGEDVRTGAAIPKFVEISKLINFKGGSLRMDQAASEGTSLRFGYETWIPEDTSLVGVVWDYKIKGSSNVYQATMENYLINNDSLTANIVLTGITPSKYDRVYCAREKVTYKTADGTQVTAAESDFNERSISGVADAILANRYATATDKQYAQEIKNAMKAL